MTVQEVPADAVLITDSSEVSHLRSMFELLESEAYDSFFVIVKDGHYPERFVLCAANLSSLRVITSQRTWISV